MDPRIYLDNNATTFLDPRVKEAMIQSLLLQGNPSSVHSYGQEAKAALNRSRRTIADYLGVKPSEILFTSGGTEGLNMLLRGYPRGHIVTSSVEHACVYETIKALGPATFIQPGLRGAPRPEEVEKAITSHTTLIATMAVNNETGVKTDIAGIASLAKQRKIPFVVDAVCWLGKEPIEIPPGVTAMAFSGHKFHAPKGVGFVYIRSSSAVDSLLLGGVQEYGKRGGTENLPGIVGMAEAIRCLDDSSTQRMQFLRDKLETKLLSLGDVTVNGQAPRVCNTSNLSFKGVEGETLLTKLDLAGIAVSHGSACSSGALEPSRILLNMGIPREEAASSIRISLSRFTTEEEIDRACEAISTLVRSSRAMRQ